MKLDPKTGSTNLLTKFAHLGDQILLFFLDFLKKKTTNSNIYQKGGQKIDISKNR